MLASMTNKPLSLIHAGLAGKELLPDQHLVDAGYVDAANLLQSQQQYEVDLTTVQFITILGGKPIPRMMLRISALIGRRKL